MKYKYPKSVKIGAHTYKMIYSKKDCDGEFSYPYKKEKPFIRIGMRDSKSDEGDFLNILIHEVAEIIHCELGNRYKSPDNASNYHFCYHHKEHTTFCAMLAGVLQEFIR